GCRKFVHVLDDVPAVRSGSPRSPRLHRCRWQEVVAQSQRNRMIHVHVEQSRGRLPEKHTDSGCPALSHVLVERPDFGLVCITLPSSVLPRFSKWPFPSFADGNRLIALTYRIESRRDAILIMSHYGFSFLYHLESPVPSPPGLSPCPIYLFVS